MKEDFSHTKEMLLETVQPICNFFNAFIEYKPKEELFYFLFPVALLVWAAKAGVKPFLQVNACLSFLYGGLMIFWPEALLEITYNGEIDTTMRFCSALYGLYQIGSTFFPLFLMNSKDKSILISFYWSKIIENCLIVVDSFVTTTSPGSRWNHKLLCYSSSSSVCIAFFMIYFLMQTTHTRSQFHFKLFQVNRIAKIEFFLLMVSGVITMAYPAHMLSSFGHPNAHEGHFMLFRLCGAILLGFSIQSFHCPSFLFEADKYKFFQARIVLWFAEVLVGLYSYFYLHALDKSALVNYFALNVSYGCMVFCGFYLCQQQLGEYQQQVEISLMESEASFNMSKHSFNEGQAEFESETDKKDD